MVRDRGAWDHALLDLDEKQPLVAAGLAKNPSLVTIYPGFTALLAGRTVASERAAATRAETKAAPAEAKPPAAPGK